MAASSASVAASSDDGWGDLSNLELDLRSAQDKLRKKQVEDWGGVEDLVESPAVAELAKRKSAQFQVDVGEAASENPTLLAGNVGGATVAGLRGLAGTISSTVARPLDLIGSKVADEWAYNRDVQLAAQAKNAANAGLNPVHGFVTEHLPGVIQSIGVSAAGGALGKVGQLAAMGAASFSDSLATARAENLPLEQQLQYALTNAGIEVGSEAVPIGNLDDFFLPAAKREAMKGAKRGIAGKVLDHLKDTAGEMVQEGIATVPSAYNDAAMLPSRSDAADWTDASGSVLNSPQVQGLKNAASAVALQGGVMAGVKKASSLVAHFSGRSRDEAKAKAVEALGEDAVIVDTRRIREKGQPTEWIVKAAPPVVEQPAADVVQQPTDEFSDEDRAFMAALRGEQAQPAVDASVVGAGAAQSELPVSAPVEQPVELGSQVVPEAGQVDVPDEITIMKDGIPQRVTVTAIRSDDDLWHVKRVKLHDDASGSYSVVDVPEDAIGSYDSPEAARADIFSFLQDKYSTEPTAELPAPEVVPASEYKAKQLPNGNWEVRRKGRAAFISKLKVRQKAIEEARLADAQRPMLTEEPIRDRTPARVQQGAWMRQMPTEPMRVGQPVAVGNETGFATKTPVTEEAVATPAPVEQPAPSEPTGPVSSLLSEPVASVQIGKSKRKGKTRPAPTAEAPVAPTERLPPATTEPAVPAEKTPTVDVSTPPARQGSGPLNMAGESRSPKPKKEKSPVPSFDSLPSASRDKFNSAFDSADVDGMTQLLDKMNRGLRAEFERRSGVTLPSTVKGTREAVANHFKGKAAVPELQPWQMTSRQFGESQHAEAMADDNRKSAIPFLNDAWKKGTPTFRTDEGSKVRTLTLGQVKNLLEKHGHSIAGGTPTLSSVDRGEFAAGSIYGGDYWLSKADGRYMIMPAATDYGPSSDHRRAIKKALASGEAVPPNVLAEYPGIESESSSQPSPQVSAQPETTSPQVEPKQVANVSQRGLPGLETEAEHLESIERMNLDTRANREALTAIGGTRFAEDHSKPLRRLPMKVLRQLEQDGAIDPGQVAYLLRQDELLSESIDKAQYQEWLDGVAADAIKNALDELKTVNYTSRGHSTTFSIGDRVRVNDDKGTISKFTLEDGVIVPEFMMDGDKYPSSYSFDDVEHVDEAREARLAEQERLREEADALRDAEEDARYLESQKKPKEDFLNSPEQIAAREKFEAEKARAPEKAAEDYSKKMADDFDRNGFTTRYDDPEFKNLFDQMDDAQKKKAVKRLVELGIVSEMTGRKRNVVNSGELMREAAGIMRRLYEDQPRTIQGKHREAFSESDVYKKATGQKIEQADAAVQEYERTGQAADSEYIKEQIEGMQRTRAQIDQTTTYKRNAESDRDKKRKNSKDYKRLTEIIDSHAKKIGELELNYELAKLEVERARIEDVLVSPSSRDAFNSGMYALHTNTARTHRAKADHIRFNGGSYRSGESDYKIANDAQAEADVYANKIMDRAKSIALADGTLNVDEATNISHEAFRDFAYWKPTSLEEVVAKLSLQAKAKRAGWKGEELDRIVGLTVDEAKAFKAEIAVAAEGGSDWIDAADAIIERAKAVAKKVTDKQEADKKKADEEKAAEIKKLQAEKEAREREMKRKAAVEARYWNRLKERTKKADWEELTYQIRKGDDEKSSVTGDTFGSATLGVHENKNIPTDAEGNVTGKPELSYTVTHLPSGWSIGTYKSKADARSFAVMMEESGLPWSEVREKDGITSEMASKAGRHTKAFDNTDLDYLNDDERAEVLKTAQPSSDQVKADHVLDSTAVGFGETPVKDITKKLKEFAEAVPEFAFNPVFTVTKKGEAAELTFDNKIGFRFNLTSDFFGADASQFEVGDTVGIDLKDLGVAPITEQEMVAEKLKNVGFDVSTKGKVITAKWVLGTERQSFTVSKDTGSWSMEGKGVEGQFNGGRVITEANRFIEQVQQAGVDAANRMVEATGTGPLNPETGKELLAEANDLVMKIGKKWAGRANDITSLLTDEVVRDMARIASAYIKAGKVIFSEYVKEVMNSSPTFNRDVIKALGPNLVRAWNARRATNKLLNEAKIEDLEPLISAPQEPPEETPPSDPITAAPKRPDESRSYSIQEAMREADRRERGVDPLEDIPAESIERWQYLANERMKADSATIKKLENRLLSGNLEKMDNVDVMILQHRKVQLQNEFAATQEALEAAIESGTDKEIALAQIEADVVLEEYSQFDQATQRAGNIAGKTLRAFQVLMRDDYSLDTMVRRAVVKNAGHPLSKAQLEEIAELHKTIADLQEKLKTAMSEAAQTASGDALEEAVGEMVASAPKKPAVARMNRPAKIQKKVDDAWSIFGRAVLDYVSAKSEAKEIRTSSNISPEEAAADVVKAYREIGVSSLSELMEELQDHPEAQNFQSAFESAWNSARSAELKGEIDVNDPKSLSKAARALAREFVENGMRGAQNVSQAVHGVISKEFPGVTLRQVSDAISGYGQFSPPSQDEVDIEMSSIRGVLQSLSKTQDVESGVPPKKTGQGRHPKSAEQRAQDRLLDAAMKKFKVAKAKSPEQLRSIIDGIETRLRNQIADMDEAIKKNIKIVRSKGGTEYEASTLKLIADRDAKKAEYEAHFGKEVKKLSEEKRAELAMKAAEKSLANWTERLESGQIEAKRKGFPPTNENLEALRAQRDAVRSEVEYMRKWYEYETSPKPTAEELEARQRELNQRATETRLRNQLADLLDRKAKGEFDPKKKRPPTPPTPAITDLKKQVVAVKRDIAAAAEKVRLARRNNVEIAKDTFKALFLDSMYSVKLGFDASVIGVQGLKAIASHPVRILPEAVKAMARGWIQSMADADQVEFEKRDNFKNGVYDKMKLALGDKIDAAELRNINAKLPGLLQKGLKYPLAAIHASQRSARNAMNVIRAEYADALIEKTERRNLSNLRANAADMLIAGATLDGTLTDEQLRNIGKDVNSLTGHGHLGVFEQAATAASQVFLSPRWLKAKFDYVTLKTLRTATKTRVVGDREVVGADWDHRRMMVSEAYGRPIIAMAALAGLAYIAKSLAGGDDDEPFMDFDPRSPKFLSMNFGNDRYYDLTAGLAKTVGFLARVGFSTAKAAGYGPGSTKGVTYGENRNDKVLDIVWRYLLGQASPSIRNIPNAAYSLATGEDLFSGKKVTPLGMAADQFLPMGPTAIAKMLHKADNIPVGLTAAVFMAIGANENLFEPRVKPWGEVNNYAADEIVRNWNRENPTATWAPGKLEPEYTVNKVKHQMTAKQSDEYAKLSGEYAKKSADQLLSKLSPSEIKRPSARTLQVLKHIVEKSRAAAKRVVVSKTGKMPDAE